MPTTADRPQTAWQTIGRANGRNWNPGDRLLFEGGQTFNVAGSAGSNVVVNPSFDAGLGGWTDTLRHRRKPRRRSTPPPAATAARSSRSPAPPARAAGRHRIRSPATRRTRWRFRRWSKPRQRHSPRRHHLRARRAEGRHLLPRLPNNDWDETELRLRRARRVRQGASSGSRRKGDNSTVYADDFTLNSPPQRHRLRLDRLRHRSRTRSSSPPTAAARRRSTPATASGFWGHNVAGVQVAEPQLRRHPGTRPPAPAGTSASASSSSTRATTTPSSSTSPSTSPTSAASVGRHPRRRMGGQERVPRRAASPTTSSRGNGDVGIHIRGEFDKNSDALRQRKSLRRALPRLFQQRHPGQDRRPAATASCSATRVMGTVERTRRLQQRRARATTTAAGRSASARSTPTQDHLPLQRVALEQDRLQPRRRRVRLRQRRDQLGHAEQLLARQRRRRLPARASSTTSARGAATSSATTSARTTRERTPTARSRSPARPGRTT